ncbi:hypothetical protein AVEN_156263-1 [Araneus ventricosus]|uniref:Uncharacterized protein n=1 Tax=Araneus ventricosus TaxID=182803 RepID=A0A4Y2EQA3_ARAVE|nr:hypothetical protein AVEN_156263-1 [Araneus ventricosus]
MCVIYRATGSIQWHRVSNPESSNPEARALPPGHRAPPAVASFMASTDHCPQYSPSGLFLNLGVFCKVKEYVLFTWPILPDFGPYYPIDIKKKNTVKAKVVLKEAR